MDIAASHVRPGVTTDEIDEIVHNETIKRDSYPSPLNYRGYPKSVCTYVSLWRISSVGLTVPYRSINESICHGIPDQRKLQEGDIINIGMSPGAFRTMHVWLRRLNRCQSVLRRFVCLFTNLPFGS